MYLAIDLGGTKTLISVFDENGTKVEETKFPTPKEYDEFLNQIRDSLSNLSNHSFKSGAIGSRGLIDSNTGVLVFDDTLGWSDKTITTDIARIAGCSLLVENDSNLAGLSEANLEDIKVYKKTVYVTISTGIGSVYIVDGKIDYNLADSEIGHIRYEHDGQLLRWEEFASGKAIVDKYGKRASEIEDPEIWREISSYIGVGIITIAGAYTPDLIIFGGGVGAHLDKFKGYLEEFLKLYEHPKIKVPPIIQAKQPEEAVIYGCYQLAKQNS